ncbi:MAG TPA: RNA polymerase Rpb6 [Flavobacteriales bacterium]|nr:RNA polymerase Rpb6 [Flavobacteriales bacterium]
MNFKKTNAELTTITRNTNDLASKTGNIYESVAVLSKRANQISDLLKDELISKINEFASQNDNLEEVFENREQIEISKFYESLPKPSAISMEELIEDKIYIRKPEEEIPEDPEG